MVEAIVKFTVPGFHYWPEAKGKRSYLAVKHRHLFHVQVQVELKHNERDIEFHDLLDFCKEEFPGGEMGAKSCETMASQLLDSVVMEYPDRMVTVAIFEDGEVGAAVSTPR